MSNSITTTQFQAVISICKNIFELKMSDYGTAWRILRVSSLTDQIYIKANRIRSIQIKSTKMVDEDIENEFVGIINYAAMAIIQLRKGVSDRPDLSENEAPQMFEGVLQEAFQLMNKKNHDYDEAWRNMRVSSLTDIILMKLLRIKQIEDNKGATLVSEGIDANFFDIINYAVFALILLDYKPV
ncbi:MAG: hypothetical protein FD155_2039 [Bacteroidetes bacterium]|nr:MAG: hypothetical protein FD155_2039 [Bacteroidota bacterium]